MIPATLSLEDALALEGLQHRIELAARSAVSEAGATVNVDEIVARVRAELAKDLAPLEESVAEVNDRIEDAVENALPAAGPAPDQPAPEPAAEEPTAESEPEPPAAPEPEPAPANVEPETQAPARSHFLHRRLGKAS